MGQVTMTSRGLGYCTGVEAGLYGEGISRRIGPRFGRGLGIGHGLCFAYGRRNGFGRFF